jgi:competence protein ComGC
VIQTPHTKGAMKANFQLQRWLILLTERRRSPVQKSAQAFTRLELVAILSTLVLLAVVVLPVLANTKPRADRLTCLNNLRLIGRAAHLWANDHRDQMPWRIDIGEGGTQRDVRQNNSYFNYAAMSNELATATILACPSDGSTKTARTFSSSPVDGLLHPSYRNSAVSYFIGLDSFVTEGILYVAYAAALAGDRNLRVDGVNVSCSSGVTVAAAVSSSSPSVTRWTNAIHGITGSLLMIDGQVTQTSNARVVRGIAPTLDDNGSSHLLMPR